MRKIVIGFLALLPALGCGPATDIDAGVLSAPITGSYSFSGATNVAIGLGRAFIARGSSLGVLDLTTGASVSYTVTTHDVAVLGNYVYALNAVKPGASPNFSNQGGSGTLNVITFANPASPAYAASGLSTNVGPYSGIAVGGSNRFVVSGGTGLLRGGTFTGSSLSTNFTRDLGTGQPDVTLSSDGTQAYVSTDFDGNNYGITVLNMSNGATLDRVFLVSGSSRVLNTPGSATPANFGMESSVVPGRSFILTTHIDGMVAISLTSLDNNINTSPVLRSIASSTLGVTPISVDVYGTRAYIVGSSPSPRLVIVDVDTFQVLGSVALSGTPRSVAVDANNVVVANLTGVQVLARTSLP